MLVDKSAGSRVIGSCAPFIDLAETDDHVEMRKATELVLDGKKLVVDAAMIEVLAVA
jgi:hypothetical protein